MTTERFGRMDVLVNNAGIISVGPAQAMTRQDFAEAMDVDFWGTLNPILAVLPQMRERRGGRIVNITSIGGKVSVPHLLPYSCAKFAATALSEGLRAELARDGIVVTTIVPGLLRTGSYDQALFKGDHAGEYDWFSVSDNLPGQSISAERAAREIVRATRRGEGRAHAVAAGEHRRAGARPRPRHDGGSAAPGQPRPAAAGNGGTKDTGGRCAGRTPVAPAGRPDRCWAGARREISISRTPRSKPTHEQP